MKKCSLFFTLFLFFVMKISAQENIISNISGNFQINLQTYNKDSVIGAKEVPEKMLLNGFANILFSRGNFSAGIRYEGYLNTLQGFDSRNDGQGIPYKFVNYKSTNWEISAGNFYEQFGNGLIFRTYEDKTLGYDNAMDGLRLKYSPFNCLTLKGIIGKQRYFFQNGEGILRGIDAELNVNQIFDSISPEATQIILGGSFVSKYQKDDDPVYKLPENVGAFSTRMLLSKGNFLFSSEFAHKINDPNADNGFIYKNGNGFLVNTSFSQKNFSILFAAKRIDNMNFRSDRSANLNNLIINYLPVITKTYTYALAAMYPYSTQPNGEIGFQTELMYKFAKNSVLGGKYGTSFNIGFSQVKELKKKLKFDGTGYESEILNFGEKLYFQEINFEINKRWNEKLSTILTYLYQSYNKDVVQGVAGYGIIYSHIGIADITYKIKPRHSVRCEFQHLATKQDYRNWAMAMIEYSFSPYFFFAMSDQYNYDNPHSEQQLHYFIVSTGWTQKNIRFAVNYGRQRAGIVCVGGVCRNVPASNGLTFSITGNF